MYQFLLVVHFIICILLVVVVLLQTGVGAQLGAAFGGTGGVNQIRTPENLIGKLTTIFAIIFIVSSVSLAIFSTDDTSVFDETTPTTETAPKE